MNTKHTPTPLSIFSDNDKTVQILDCMNRVITTLDKSNYELAEFIVRAVNSHEELLNIAKKSLDYVRKAEPIDCQLEVDLMDAISKAEGK